KEAIAAQVRQQIGAEYAEANRPGPQAVSPAGEQAPSALDPNQRIFVVSTDLAVNAGGQECALTPGDIIMRTNDTMISARNTDSVGGAITEQQQDADQALQELRRAAPGG